MSATTDTSWPEHLELQARGGLDVPVLNHAVATLAETLCPEEVTIAIRIVRADDEFDLLYHIPCDDRAAAINTLANDIRAYSGEKDAFRTWFRSRWMGQDEEDQFTVEELSAEPLTAERMLAYLDPPKFRDWRPIQSFIERHANCRDLVRAMEAAVTTTQMWRLAYVFNHRRRSCESAVPILLAWLEHPDRQVREEAADSLGQVVLGIRHLPTRRRWAHEAGPALVTYVTEHSDDNLYFARTALGAIGYEPARPYLQQVADTSSGHRRESAERGLLNLENARKTFGE